MEINYSLEEAEKIIKGDVAKSKRLDKYVVHESQDPTNDKITISSSRSNKKVEKDEIRTIRSCHLCDKVIKKTRTNKKPFPCKCKKVLFCSNKCKQSSPHFSNCETRSEPFEVSLKDLVASVNDNDRDVEDEETVEMREKFEDLLKRAKDPKKIEKLAIEGDPVAAWHIGCSFSNRIATSSDVREAIPIFMPKEYLKESVDVTDEMAIKFFEIAAKGGYKQGSFSLAHKIFKAKSLNIDQRIGIYWMAKAHVQGCKDAMKVLENEMMLVKDVEATSSQFFSMPHHLRPQILVNGMTLGGPNLGNFLLATRLEEIVRWNGNTKLGLEHPMYGFEHFEKLKEMQDFLPITAGLAGTGGGVSNLAVTKKRTINNIMYYQGSRDENSFDVLLAEGYGPFGDWASEERTKYKVCCTHNDVGGKIAGQCKPCQTTAKSRIIATREGKYCIGYTESIPGYGYNARFSNEDGDIISDTFKSYSQPEIACVLQCLMSNPADLHPIFIAEDGNLYWPIIWYYGSVYNAISQCCNTATVNKVYGSCIKKSQSQLPPSNPVSEEILSAFPDFAINQLRMTCGNDICPQFEGQRKFMKCAACRVRFYCSRDCQVKDFKIHKKECKAQNQDDNRAER